MTARDKRALTLLVPGVAAVLGAYWYVSQDTAPTVAPVARSSGPPEQRLAKLRETAAALPAKEKVLKDLTAQLAEREKGLLQADTAPQAQAALIQILRRLCGNNGVEIKQTELVAVDLIGDAYSRVVIGVQADCRIEQLINLLADISKEPAALSTYSLNIDSGDPKQKTIKIRLVVAAAAPRNLLPAKKGA